MTGIAARMDAYLSVQGYQLSAEQRRALRVGVRLPTALCLALVVTGLVARSAVLVLALVPIGIVAGWTPRHPFDAVWNHGLRHLKAAPPLPPNPRRRRHTFKLATVWLAGVGALLALGQTAAALGFGAVLVGVCALVTATNICIPSILLSAWAHRHRTGAAR
ncbi:MAG TPA: DUF4395 family protein [Actinomycetes bacterium]|jgi:hypothetical protein|nr:DUF4395 family protein [Actinomycetes bacterium]